MAEIKTEIKEDKNNLVTIKILRDAWIFDGKKYSEGNIATIPADIYESMKAVVNCEIVK